MKGQTDVELMAKWPLSGLLHTISRWQALHRERQMLAGMSDDALKDIGLNRIDVEQEIHRHFWEDPLRK
ncbi:MULTISPECIES: DUF1127 domain-containing protein [unclassified Pseudomonas]|uniref:DUF1127 domain-containing protein n=1 Tax=unclassified Pseudomonas TaxID=196821 RepID=UPI000F6D5025|nr:MULTISPECIES: DUF1127 domain-containing protein [unclassified Pseudomonas]AZF25801.1 hypothetical protein C4J90_1614 [Pseudomonas sp. R2-60-08W]AZF36445.1 hypothetical protein C4J88_1648 [Pseudomonas sp. R4-39-08]AZF52106.1 hypothetical protein C4J85_1607 [Pseudomonas sp. R4-34-07]